MPIYEYLCTSCDYSFEERQGFDAEPVCACPKCRNEARRRFVPAPIIFKGSGFYVTDYNGKSPSAGKNGSASGEEKEEAKTAVTATTPTKDSTKENDS